MSAPESSILLPSVASPDREAAEAQGAQWDPRARKWYVPEGMDSEPFKAWLPLWEEEYQLHINGPLFVAEAKSTCWSCGESTPVVALATEMLDENGDPYICTLLEVEEIPSALSLLFRKHHPFFRMSFSEVGEIACFMNHCRCGASQEDWHLHHEPGETFFPLSPEEAMTILLRRIPGSKGLIFKAAYSISTHDFIGCYAARVD
jgi:hypothetical protein